MAETVKAHPDQFVAVKATDRPVQIDRVHDNVVAKLLFRQLERNEIIGEALDKLEVDRCETFRI
jgi:hypothetical protein